MEKDWEKSEREWQAFIGNPINDGRAVSINLAVLLSSSIASLSSVPKALKRLILILKIFPMIGTASATSNNIAFLISLPVRTIKYMSEKRSKES